MAERKYQKQENRTNDDNDGNKHILDKKKNNLDDNSNKNRNKNK